jgi:hypothetical protein
MSKLIRRGRSKHKQSGSISSLIKSADDEAKAVREDFDGFSRQNSDFSVEYKWSDVRSLIYFFSHMNHPDAVLVHRMLRPIENARAEKEYRKHLAEMEATEAAEAAAAATEAAAPQ